MSLNLLSNSANIKSKRSIRNSLRFKDKWERMMLFSSWLTFAFAVSCLTFLILLWLFEKRLLLRAGRLKRFAFAAFNALAFELAIKTSSSSSLSSLCSFTKLSFNSLTYYIESDVRFRHIRSVYTFRHSAYVNFIETQLLVTIEHIE